MHNCRSRLDFEVQSDVKVVHLEIYVMGIGHNAKKRDVDSSAKKWKENKDNMVVLFNLTFFGARRRVWEVYRAASSSVAYFVAF